MNRGIFATLSGAMAQEYRFQVLANNIANLKTTGYKRVETAFGAIMAARAMSLGGPFAPSAASRTWFSAANGPGERVFVTPRGLSTNLSEGELVKTGNQFDVAIQGTGFFEVKTPQGLLYTRNGAFHLDGQRRLVTASGDPVMGNKGPITLGRGEVRVEEGGRILVNGVEAAQIKVVEFPNTKTLRQVGEGLYAGEGGKPIKKPTVVVGSLEQSNVNPFGAMVGVIEVTRAYESSQKLLQAFDRMTELAIQEVGRVA
jgi:flagellar basal-body rod protein FlgG